MRKILLLVYPILIILSCKKTSFEKIEGDSFRISILPVNSTSFNQFKIMGTLDIRKVSGDLEYGLVVSKSINPTLESGQKYVLGKSKSSVDFTRELTGLDTGSVYFVRAYGIGNNKPEYSANQIIGKMSPQITWVDNILNYGRTFSIFTNISSLSPNVSVKIFLNTTEIAFKSISPTNVGIGLTASLTNKLAPGEYTLSMLIDNLKIVYPKKLTLFEGTWQQLDDLPIDNGGVLPSADYFVNGDWIYTYGTGQGGITTRTLFNKYNYKTKERITLTPFDDIFRLDKAAVMQEGDNIHFITGEKTASFQNSTVTKGHYVYHTVTDSWTTEADFPGEARKNAISIVANNKLYVGMGYDPGIISVRGNIDYADMYSYDLTTKLWKKVADFPQSTGRLFNASFAIGSKLYITAGAIESGGLFGSSIATKETWCYDTTIDQWSRKADYPGKGEIMFNNFSIGSYGYVGMGQSITYSSYYGKNFDLHFFKYDPAANRWNEVSSTNQGISKPMSGSNNTQGFYGAGGDANGASNKTFYIFTP